MHQQVNSLTKSYTAADQPHCRARLLLLPWPSLWDDQNLFQTLASTGDVLQPGQQLHTAGWQHERWHDGVVQIFERTVGSTLLVAMARKTLTTPGFQEGKWLRWQGVKRTIITCVAATERTQGER